MAADLLGVSGRGMLRALVAGERDPGVLAELARGRLRTKLPQLRQALPGRFNDHHRLLVGLALDHLEHLEAAIATLDGRTDEVIAPFAVATDRLGDHHRGRQAGGRGHHRRHAAWTGRSSPTAGHLASWAGRCPGNNRTGGRCRSGTPTKSNHWLAEVLTECAWAATHRRDTDRSAQLLAAGPPHRQQKAAGPVGHSILVVAWHLLAAICDDRHHGGDFFVQHDTDRARHRAVAQLQALGYQVTLHPTTT